MEVVVCYTIVRGVLDGSVGIRLCIPWRCDTLISHSGCRFSEFRFYRYPWVVLVHCMFVPLWVLGSEGCNLSSVGVAEHMGLVEVVLGLQRGKCLSSTFLLQAIFRCCVVSVSSHRNLLVRVSLLCITLFVSHIILDF